MLAVAVIYAIPVMRSKRIVEDYTSENVLLKTRYGLGRVSASASYSSMRLLPPTYMPCTYMSG